MGTIASKFLDAPIRRKLVVTNLIAVIFSMLLSFVLIIAVQIRMSKNDVIGELKLLSDITSKRLAPIMEWSGDLEELRKTVTDISTKKSLTVSCIFNINNELVLEYQYLIRKNFSCPKTMKEFVFPNKLKYIYNLQDIKTKDNERVGGILIISNLKDFYNKLLIFSLILAAVLGATFIFILYFTGFIYKRITEPLSNLKTSMLKIVASGNYNLKVAKQNSDEIGTLVDTFNTMMDEIEKRDGEIKEINQTLESKVDERTYELQEALKAKGRFITNMSHELRTPNHHLLGLSGFVKNDLQKLEEQLGELSQDQLLEKVKSIAKYADRLSTACQKEARLINNIQDLEKMTSENIEFHIISHNIIGTINETLRSFSGDALEYITFKNKSDQPLYALYDEVQLRKVIDNLISNAITFAAKAAVSIEVKETVYLNGKGEKVDGVQFTITDNGPGIPDNELEFIFEVFGESTRTKNQSGGRGLGLAISREIINKHQGFIWAANNQTTGASFYFVLPK